MVDPLTYRPIEELYRVYSGNQRMMNQLSSPNIVMARFQRRPENYLYFIDRNGSLSMTPVDIDAPVLGLLPIELGHLPGFDDVVSGSSGLLVRVIRCQSIFVVWNPLYARHVRIVPFPSILQLSNVEQIGPAQIFANQANSAYIIWFYVYPSLLDNRTDGNTGMFIFHSHTGLWTQLSSPGITCPFPGFAFSNDDLVIDEDVSASLFPPWGGILKYKARTVSQGGDIIRANLPPGYERGDGCFTSYGHLAVIGRITRAFQTETVRSTVTGQLEQLCFVSRLYGCWVNELKWNIEHVVADTQLLDVIFDPDNVSGAVTDRIVVTADSQYFYVCARNDTRVFRVNPCTGLVEVVVGNGVLTSPRHRVFAMPATFITP